MKRHFKRIDPPAAADEVDPMFKKIVVGLPSYDGRVAPQCKASLEKLQAYNNSHSAKTPHEFSFEIRIKAGSSSLFLRNHAASNGDKRIKQKLNYDYFLSIDADMAFSVESIIRLVQSFEALQRGKGGTDVGAIGGAYSGRGSVNSHLLVAGDFDEVAGEIPPSKWLSVETNGLHKVDWCGTGFLLIPKDVLEALEYPWFRSYAIEKKGMAELCTEDVGICMDIAGKLHRTIWVDCDIRIAHLIH